MDSCLDVSLSVFLKYFVGTKSYREAGMMPMKLKGPVFRFIAKRSMPRGHTRRGLLFSWAGGMVWDRVNKQTVSGVCT